MHHHTHHHHRPLKDLKETTVNWVRSCSTNINILKHQWLNTSSCWERCVWGCTIWIFFKPILMADTNKIISIISHFWIFKRICELDLIFHSSGNIYHVNWTLVEQVAPTAAVVSETVKNASTPVTTCLALMSTLRLTDFEAPSRWVCYDWGLSGSLADILSHLSPLSVNLHFCRICLRALPTIHSIVMLKGKPRWWCSRESEYFLLSISSWMLKKSHKLLEYESFFPETSDWRGSIYV